jgi:phosphoribosylglycinamide formyltransferase-1
MQALIKAAAASDYPAEIALVVSNRDNAAGLDIARQHRVPVFAVPSRDFGPDRAAHEAAMEKALHEAGCKIICLAGYMRLLTPYLINRWAGRMLNIHPSLLPAFPGLNTHARALAARVKIHGCTVHLVTEAMDEGPILAQAAIPVLPDDTEQVLSARVLAQEHLLYPATLAALLSAHVPNPAKAGDYLRNPIVEAVSRARNALLM